MNGIKVGFKYLIEEIRDGEVVHSQVAHNLVPTEGLNYIIDTALRNGTPFANFYVALYEGAYTPVPGDTAGTIIASATELTAYSETTRRPLTLSAAASGNTDNSASRAEFTGTTNGKLAQGGLVLSSPTKGSTSGILVSAVRFPSPRPLDSGTILRVTAGFTMVSV